MLPSSHTHTKPILKSILETLLSSYTISTHAEGVPETLPPSYIPRTPFKRCYSSASNSQSCPFLLPASPQILTEHISQQVMYCKHPEPESHYRLENPSKSCCLCVCVCLSEEYWDTSITKLLYGLKCFFFGYFLWKCQLSVFFFCQFP